MEPSAGDEAEPSAGDQIFGLRLGLAHQYADLLAGSAVQRGLIGPREVLRIWDRHVLNCAVLAPALPPSARVADVGSGAGLPGLVLAIARPDITVSLIEPLLRRVTWLNSAVDELGLSNVTIVRCRAKDVPAADRGFDVVTARAVAALPKLMEWCLPLAREQGLVLAMKGESVHEELAEAEPALRMLEAQMWSVEEYGAGTIDPPARVVRVVAGAVATSIARLGNDKGSARSRRGRR